MGQTSRLVNVHGAFVIAACFFGVFFFFATQIWRPCSNFLLSCLSSVLNWDAYHISGEKKQTLGVGLNTRYIGKKMKDRRMKRQTGAEPDVSVVRRGNIWGRRILEHDWWRIKRTGKACLLCPSFRSWRSRIVSSHIPQQEEKSRGFLRPTRLHLQRGINIAVNPFYLHVGFKDTRWKIEFGARKTTKNTPRKRTTEIERSKRAYSEDFILWNIKEIHHMYRTDQSS